MDFFEKPPDWLVKALPEGGARDFVQGSGWFVVLGIIALIILLILRRLLFKLFARKREVFSQRPSLEEDLESYPPAPAATGDRQLRVEGVPVRMRLVVVAPAGKDGVEADAIEGLLDRVLPGLGEMCRADKPRIRVWPRQLSYDGFTSLFQRNTLTRERTGELSRWVILAGRAKLGDQQIMLGLALQAVKPTTVGRRMLDAHEWPSVLRVRVRD